MGNVETKDSLEIIKNNYVELSKYTIETRTYPSIYDGCKSVYRRCLYANYLHTPRKKVKLTNHISSAMLYHPHGDSSITGAIISMASKYKCPFPLYETKGNFGDRNNAASAARYLEAMLSNLAIDIFMPFIQYADYGIPEFVEEPLALPSLLPLAFLHGAGGIGVGTPNPSIPPFNPIDLVNYYVEALKNDNFEVRDNFMVKPNIGNTIVASPRKDWIKIMNNGTGSIKLEPKIEVKGNIIEITKVPKGRSFDNLLKTFKREIDLDKIDVRDESDSEVKFVIERVPRRVVDFNDIAKRAKLKMSCSESYKFIFTDNGRAVFCNFNDVIKSNIKYTIKCVTRKFEDDISKLSKQINILKIIELMKKDEVITKLSKYSYEEAITFLTKKYKVEKDIVKSVLQKPMSYLTKEHNKELVDLNNKLKDTEFYRDNPRIYLTELYKKLLPQIKSLMKDRNMTEFKK